MPRYLHVQSITWRRIDYYNVVIATNRRAFVHLSLYALLTSGRSLRGKLEPRACVSSLGSVLDGEGRQWHSCGGRAEPVMDDMSGWAAQPSLRSYWQPRLSHPASAWLIAGHCTHGYDTWILLVVIARLSMSHSQWMFSAVNLSNESPINKHKKMNGWK